MNIEKLKSGSYRVKQMVNGVTYRVTIDHKPTDKEAEKLIAEKMAEGGRVTHKATLKSACEAYIGANANLFSTTTIRGYRALIRQIEPKLANTDIGDITKAMIQTEVNRYSIGHAPKTVKNFGVFIKSVLNFYDINLGKTKYPQAIKNEKYLPTPEEVEKILDYFRDTKFYVAIFLGCRGLRLSEVCALNVDDLSTDNMLCINKAKVRANHGYTIKTTKTTNSTRTIAIPQEIADIIHEQGFIYKGKPDNLNVVLKRAQAKLGITQFTFHQLRHFFASYTHYLGFVDKALQTEGGWVSSYILDRTYKQSMNTEEISKQISDIYAKLLRG